MTARDILVIGGPNSGKTHYAGQLYGRLQRRPARLRLMPGEATPADLTALQEVLDCLEAGRAAQHTPTNTWTEVRLPLIDDRHRRMNLTWPDYGGEALHNVWAERLVPQAWQAKLGAAHGWVLMIRLGSEVVFPTTLEPLLQQATPSPSANPARMTAWDANARWVELLQILLHVARIDTVRRIRQPRMAVLLSCYDELDAGERPPGETLRARLPLVAAFLASLWRADQLTVWGVSSLGRPLVNDKPDTDFMEDGPEHQGWIVPPTGGARDPDLSLPLTWLLGDE